MSKKESEFDRYERMKKLQKETEAEKKKNMDVLIGKRKKGGKPKLVSCMSRNSARNYDINSGNEYYEF